MVASSVKGVTWHGASRMVRVETRPSINAEHPTRSHHSKTNVPMM
jgi:hypothetical protein